MYYKKVKIKLERENEMKFIYNIILFFIISVYSYSHPHVFFDTNIEVKIENQKLEGIELQFNNKTYKEDDIIFEQAKLVDDSLEIYFFVPIDEKITKNSKLKIALYDTKYYYNYDYEKSSLKIDKNIKSKVNFFTNDKIKFYFNLVSPEEYEVTFE